MYKIIPIENRRYKLYTISTGKTLMFNGLNDLICYIAHREVSKSRSIWRTPIQSILGGLNVTGKDTQIKIEPGKIAYGLGYLYPEYRLRDFRVFNSENTSIDLRNYTSLIDANIKAIEAQGDRIYYKNSRHEHLRFRQDPVPYTSKRRRYAYYRAIRTFNERKQNSAPEVAKFVRGARKEIPSSWDEIDRSREDGWKHNTKSRKQYKSKHSSYRELGKILMTLEESEMAQSLLGYSNE